MFTWIIKDRLPPLVKLKDYFHNLKHIKQVLDMLSNHRAVTFCLVYILEFAILQSEVY